MSEEKQTRTVDIGFTKIGEDVIVPTWREQRKEGESFRDNKVVWWVLGVLWLFLVILTPSHLRLETMPAFAGIIFLIGLMWYFLGKIPQKWIEFNRKDGHVYVWTSRKKRRLIGKWHIDKVAIKMNCRWVSSGPKGQTSEHRYLIELFDTDPGMKNTSFWKFDNHPQKNGTPFFVLFDLFGDPHHFTEDSDFALASAITHQIEKFIRDFMTNRPIPDSSTSTYTFSIPE